MAAAVTLFVVSVLSSEIVVKADTIFVTRGTSTIMKYTADGQGSAFASGLPINDPWEIACDSKGNLFLSNYGNQSVVRFDPGGRGTVMASGGGPRGLALDKTGNLYVANADDNTVTRMDVDGNWSVFADVGSGLRSPTGLAIDSSGNVYVANFGNLIGVSGYIEKFDPSGHGSVYASDLFFPLYLGFDGSDRLYATGGDGSSSNWGAKFDASGHASGYGFGAGDPQGFAFDSNGNSFVASIERHA